MSSIEYRNLLFEISEKLDVNELQKLVYLCTELIEKDSAENIRDVLALFNELEKQNQLGIDRLDSLKEILRTMKKKALLTKVEKFEIRRKALKLKCNFKTVAGGLVAVSCGLVLHSSSSLEEYRDAFEKVVLPAFTKLVALSESSLCFTVQAETPSALNELWSIYKDGTLKNRLQEFLVAEEIKQLASGEDVEVTVYVDEQEYREAYLDLMLQQNEASEKKSQTGQRRRKNSDSFLFLNPKEDEVTSMKLEQAANKWNFKMQVLEREIEKLKSEVTKADDLQRRMEEKGGNGLEDVEWPQMRRRRHSDTSENEQERFLGEEKYAFVRSYLEDIRDTHSITTSASDSGLGTHGAPYEIDISDDSPKLHLKDLSEKVIGELGERLEADEDAIRQFYHSFGITYPPLLSCMPTRDYRLLGITQAPPSLLKIGYVFRLFPDTPVKLLKDVLGALQLFDLLELLEQPKKPLNARSLRIALTLDEIKKLRNTADRRTTCHSCAAVFIFVEDEDNSVAKGIKTFFTDLDSKSDVTIIQCKDLWARKREKSGMRMKMTQEEHSIQDIRMRMESENSVEREQQVESEMQKQYSMELTSELQSRRQTVERLKAKMKENEAMMMKEQEDILTAALKVIERWIQHKDNFSFFAVFDLSSSCFLAHDWFEKLMSGIPDKPKLSVFSSYTVARLPETLRISCNWHDPSTHRLLLEILNKRWQTLDLISMMAEFKRSVNSKTGVPISIEDSLSSLPRFKRKEDSSLSH